jgi:3-aminobutyryl-CoA ammonia-lyase
VDFVARVVARGRPDRSESAAEVLAEPIVATTATGTVVVPA